MADYYADSVNGNNANGGTSWADAKQTLTAVEGLGLAAGDTAHCRGVFREQLNCAAHGSAGNPITYIGYRSRDTGHMCRVSGSDDDMTATRAYGLNVTTRDYRTFRGFRVDGCSQVGLRVYDGQNFIFEDCVSIHNVIGFRTDDAALNGTLRRLMVQYCRNEGITFTASVANGGMTIENCIVKSCWYRGIYSTGTGGITVRNTLILGNGDGMRVSSLPGGFTACTIQNSIVAYNNGFGLRGDLAAYLIENYNTVAENSTNYSAVAPGANSNPYLPMLDTPILEDGVQHPYWDGKLSQWSALRSIAGSGVPADDLFGFTRAGTSSWGPIEYAAARDDSQHERYLAAVADMTGGMNK